MKNVPLVLIILDGWGYRAETNANAIALARKAGSGTRRGVPAPTQTPDN